MKNPAFKLKSILIGLGAFVVAHSTFATPASDAMLVKLQRIYPNIPFTQVNETPAPGIYEAIFGKDLLYVESTGTYFFPTMVNMATKVNLGEERRDELNKIDFSELPLKDAIKTVHGNGSRKMAVFADPNCVYCKKLEATLQNVTDVTIYTFVLGILGPDSTAKANAINAASGDRAKLWDSVMLDGARPVMTTTPAGAVATEKNMGLFKKYGFQGTPAIVFSSGATIKGYAEAARIEEMLAKK